VRNQPGSLWRESGLWALGLCMLAACGGTTVQDDGQTGGTSGSGGQAGAAGQAGNGATGGSGGSGGQTGGTGAAAGQAGTGGSGGVGGSGGSAGPSGDCSPTDPSKKCLGHGEVCIEMVPGGFAVCAVPVEEATFCPGMGPDECCDSSECAEGACFPNPVTPACGGAYPIEMNVCASDQCETDADCQGPNAFCAPRGVNRNAVRYCMSKACSADGDCTAEPGGICAPVQNPCCSSWDGLFCVYPSGCRTDADCGEGSHCEVNWTQGTGECVSGPVACPA
jgi:hypothetical protein